MTYIELFNFILANARRSTAIARVFCIPDYEQLKIAHRFNDHAAECDDALRALGQLRYDMHYNSLS